MQLDSSDSLSIADKDKAGDDLSANHLRDDIQIRQQHNGQEIKSGPEVEKYSSISGREQEIMPDDDCDWCYLFIHHSKVDSTVNIFREYGNFNTFVHKSIKYIRQDKRIVKQSKQTVSGLIFIQGDKDKIKIFLKKEFPLLHLVNNCSTHETAVIPNRVMQHFMQIAALVPTRIRFLMNPLNHYSAGNPRLRITTGVLAGLEGYLIRIDRDRRFVIAVGDMTVAISGVHKEQFENTDEYSKVFGKSRS